MTAYDVAPQRISPLLSLSGSSFEDGIEQAIRKGSRSTHYAELAGSAHNRPDNNAEVLREARRLLEREVIVQFGRAAEPGRVAHQGGGGPGQRPVARLGQLDRERLPAEHGAWC